ncbi:MAG: SLC13 family permease, partial [Hyphomicrobiales bacterium]|nr:SLC13 family permease [Hyphomicrobiales bacterium]
MLIVCALLVSTAWFLPDSIGTNGRLAIAITGLAIVGWALSPLPDSIVAIAAALALVITGVLPENKLFEALGSELIWLLVASFVIAAVV